MSQRITEYHSLDKYSLDKSLIKKLIDEQKNLDDVYNSIGLECAKIIRTHKHPPRGEFETTEIYEEKIRKWGNKEWYKNNKLSQPAMDKLVKHKVKLKNELEKFLSELYKIKRLYNSNFDLKYNADEEKAYLHVHGNPHNSPPELYFGNHFDSHVPLDIAQQVISKTRVSNTYGKTVAYITCRFINNYMGKNSGRINRSDTYENIFDIYEEFQPDQVNLVYEPLNKTFPFIFRY